jgi:hypothetical protein
MDFRVPQFIEHDPKILGPLTLSQTMFVGTAFGISFFLYFLMSKTHLTLYVIITVLLFGIAFALAFIKIEGLGVAKVGKNFTTYTLNNKLFLWKRKQSPVFLSSPKEKRLAEAKLQEKPSPLKIKETGKIENLIKKIDFEK